MTRDALELARDVLAVEKRGGTASWDYSEVVGLARALLAQAEQVGELKDKLRLCEEQNQVLGDVNIAFVEVEALRAVYGVAASLRTFPVPFDDHWALVGAVDECRIVLAGLDENAREAAALNTSDGGAITASDALAAGERDEP